MEMVERGHICRFLLQQQLIFLGSQKRQNFGNTRRSKNVKRVIINTQIIIAKKPGRYKVRKRQLKSMIEVRQTSLAMRCQIKVLILMFWLKMVLFANAAALFFWSYFIQSLTSSEALNGRILRQAQTDNKPRIALIFPSCFRRGQGWSALPSKTLPPTVLGRFFGFAQNGKGDAPSQNRCPHQFNQ